MQMPSHCIGSFSRVKNRNRYADSNCDRSIGKNLATSVLWRYFSEYLN